MFPIDNGTAAASEPVRPAAGTPGYFTKGNPSGPVAATIVDDWFLNMLQNELLEVLDQGGVTPDKADDTQVAEAIQNMIDATVAANLGETFKTASGGLTVPATGDASQAHGLSDPPDAGVDAFIRCTSADLGYSVGQRVKIGAAWTDAGSQRGVTVWWDATNVGITVSGGGIRITSRSTGNVSVIDETKWKLHFAARA